MKQIVRKKNRWKSTSENNKGPLGAKLIHYPLVRVFLFFFGKTLGFVNGKETDKKGGDCSAFWVMEFVADQVKDVGEKLSDLARAAQTKADAHTQRCTNPHEKAQTHVHVLSLSIYLFYLLLYGNVRGKQEKDMMSLTKSLWYPSGLASCPAVVILAVVCVSTSCVCFGHSSRQRLQ